MTYFAFLRENARWLIASYLLAMFSGFGQTFFISLSAGELRAGFGLSHGDLGLLYMLATLGSALTLPYVGKSLDVFPVQRVAAVVISGLALFCLIMANVAAVWMIVIAFYGLRLCGQGMMGHTSLTAAGRWFSAQRGRAVSIALLGFPSAEALFPLGFVLLNGMLGWRGAWTVSAAVLVLVVLPILFFLLGRERQPSTHEIEIARVERRHWTRHDVLRDPVFWMISLGANAPAFIGTAILFHQVYLIELRGWTLELFASAFLLMALCVIGMSLVVGPMIDRFSARRLLPFTLVPLAGACFVLSFVHAPAAAFIFLALVGVSNGYAGTLMGALWPEIYGTRYIGAIRAVAFSLMVFASAAGPGLIGWLIDLGVAYDDQLAGMGLYCVAVTLVLAYTSHALLKREFS